MFSRALKTSSQRGFVNAAVTWILVVAFASASTMVRATGHDHTFGSLSITSDPAGATVFVDGDVVGQTPLTVDQLPVGDHRVKVVKAGFLENARVVTVASGLSKNVNVKLTAGTSSGSSTVLAPGGGSKTWLILGAVAVAGAGVYLATKDKNKTPNAGTATASRPTALQGMSVGFTATGASDPDGDTLMYDWVFGDGGTGTGASTSHVYATTGNFTAVVTVSDGKKSATSSVAVTVRNLNGIWRGPILGNATFPTTVNFTQNGTTVTGTYTDSLTNLNGTLTAGSVSADGTVTFTVTITGIVPFTFTGPIDAGVNVINGRANGSGFVNASWILTRS